MSVHFLLVRHAIKEKAVGDVGITSLGEQRFSITRFAAVEHLQEIK